MTDSPSTAGGSSPPGRARAWAMTHRPQAAAAAGAVAIAALAVVKKRQAGPDASTGDAEATGTAANADTATGLTAGLSGTPYTGDTDVYNAIQDQLNAMASDINDKLSSKPAAPAAPKPATPLPKPGASRWTVRKGDTLAKIAAAAMGAATAGNIAALKRANPTLSGFAATARLDYYAGHTLTVPRPVNPPAKKPAPKKKPKKPRPPRRPKKP